MGGGNQVNSQSQCGTAAFNYGYGTGLDQQGGWSSNDGVDFEAIKKKVKIKVKAKDDSNAQGQGQIVQADFNIPFLVTNDDKVE